MPPGVGDALLAAANQQFEGDVEHASHADPLSHAQQAAKRAHDTRFWGAAKAELFAHRGMDQKVASGVAQRTAEGEQQAQRAYLRPPSLEQLHYEHGYTWVTVRGASKHASGTCV